MRGLGWNPELLPPAWPRLEGLPWEGAWVAGEAALAGYWLHHRLVGRLDVHVRPDHWDAFTACLPEARPLFPGCLRWGEVEVVREEQPPFAPPEVLAVPAQSLADLAVDRWLQAFGGGPQGWLVDLYFLERARVDLALAARRIPQRDAAATQRSLAVILHETQVELPGGLVRPVTREQIEDFRLRWTDQLALELFS